MKNILIVGGANGIGLAIAKILESDNETSRIYIVDKKELSNEYKSEKIKSFVFDLECGDFSFFEQFDDIDSLMITAGFGRLDLFKDINQEMISSYFDVNTIAPIRIIKYFYDKLLNDRDFYCGVMVSIAGFMSSPFFSVYAATKAALKVFIESVNVELEKAGSSNKILNVSPGSITGTGFIGKKTNLDLVMPLAKEIVCHLKQKDDLFIPKYEEVFCDVLERYHKDFRAEGRHSYDYKLQNRINK